MNIQPIRLVGPTIRLDPMTKAHAAALAKVGLTPELWRLQPAPVSSAEDMRRYVDRALEEKDAATALPFVIVDSASRGVIGSTRFMDIAVAHRRLEIGASWLAPAWQRTGANAEAKLLLLTHAFEVLAMQRVVFKTDVLNEQSRNALLRMGAVQEGIFRKHFIAASGRARDMVYFSILDTEWPAAKSHLLGRLRRRNEALVSNAAALQSIIRFVPVSGSLATAGQPSENQLADVAAAGIEVVINLALHDDPRYSLPDEGATVRALGMEYIHIPVQFSSPGLPELELFFAAMERAGSRRALVHCAHNKRVPVFVALYRVIRQGWAEDEAFTAMREVWSPDATWNDFIAAALAHHAAAPPGGQP